MKNAKVWKRFLVALLSFSMVASNLSVGSVYAYSGSAGESVTASSDEEILDEEDLQNLEDGEDFPEAVTSGDPDALEIEGIEEIPVDLGAWEDVEETESETETQTGLEGDVPDVEKTESGEAGDAGEISAAEDEEITIEEIDEAESLTMEAADGESDDDGLEAVLEDTIELLSETELGTEAASEAETESEMETAADDSIPALEEDTEYDVRITKQGETVWFQFTPELSGIYSFSSAGDYDTVAYLYTDPEGEPLEESDDISTADANFDLRYALEAGTTYYYSAQMCYEYVTGAFSVSISYVSRSVKEAVVKNMMHTTWYQKFDSNFSAQDMVLDVTYTDGTKETVHGSSVTLKVTASNVYVDGIYTLKKGTYTAVLSYLDWSMSAELVVTGIEDAPTLGAVPVNGRLSTGDYYLYTPESSGAYVFDVATQSDSYNKYISVYNTNAETISSLIDNRDNYLAGQVVQLTQGVTYVVKVSADYYSYYYGEEYTAAARPVGSIVAGTPVSFSDGRLQVYAFIPEDTAYYQMAVKEVVAADTDDSYARYLYWYNADGQDLESGRVYESGSDSDGNFLYSTEITIEEALKSAETYYLVFNPHSNVISAELSVGKKGIQNLTIADSVSDTIAEDEELYYEFTAPADGIYRFCSVADSYMYLDIQGDYGSVYNCSGRYLEEDYSYDLTVRLMAGEVYLIRAYSGYEQQFTLSVSEVPEVASMEISSLPEKTDYARTDDFDWTGLSVTVTYADGRKEILSAGQYSEISGCYLRPYYNILASRGGYVPGTYDITVSHLDQECTYQVTVLPDSAEKVAAAYQKLTLNQETEISSGTMKYYFTVPETGIYRIAVSNSSYYPTLLDSMGLKEALYQEKSYSSETGGYISYRYDYLKTAETYLLEGYVSEDGILLLSDDVPALTDDTSVSGTTNGSNFFYAYKPESDGEYSFTLELDTSYKNLYPSVYSEAEDVASSYESSEVDGRYVYEITVAMQAGQYYLFRCYCSASDIAYTVSRTRTSSYDAVELVPGSTYDVIIDTAGGSQWFSYTPEETGRYNIYSTDNTGDPYVELYRSNRMSRLAYNDDGGDNANFRLAYELKAGVTYYYKARLYSSSDTGTYTVHFSEIPEVSSMSISSDSNMANVYYALARQSFSAEGLAVDVTYADGSEETVTYGSVSGYGLSLEVDSSGIEYAANVMKPGTYEIPVTYAGETINCEITVLAPSEAATALTVGTAVSGTLGSYEKHIYSFTPEESGRYIVTASDDSTYLYPVLYTETQSISYKYNTTKYYSNDDGDVYVACNVYELTAGTPYYVMASLNGSGYTDTAYTLKMARPQSYSAGMVLEGTAEAAPLFAEMTVTEAGYYEFTTILSDSASSSSNYMQLYALDDSYSSVKYESRQYSGSTSTDSGTLYQYTCRYYMYLEEGTYLLSGYNYYSYAYVGRTYTLTGERAVSWNIEDTVEDTTESSTYTCRGYELTAPKTGPYTFTLASSMYSCYMYLYDQNMNRVGTSASDSVYSDGVYTYTKTVGAELTAGEKYLVYIYTSSSSASGKAYTLTGQYSPEVEALEILQYPQQVYYYKVDKVTADTNLGAGLKVQVTYADGKTETISYGSASTYTGGALSVTLPEDAGYNSSGYLKTGTYQAALTYLNQTAEIPITVKTVTHMPSVTLDENGQGSYTGEVENACGYGYIRFTGITDGFYNLTLSVDNGYYINYNKIVNSAYSEMATYSASASSTDTRYLCNTSVYVRAGQSCYIKYYKYYGNGAGGEFTLSVEKATDQRITELTCNEAVSASITSTSVPQWFSFTPEKSGTYILNTKNATGYHSIYLYQSPDASSYLSSGYYTSNGNNRYLSYSLTAGKTYYYRISSNYTCSFDVTIVKQVTNAVSLELLTEGIVYCSSLPDYIDNSFADLEFLATYADGTTETLTFGYNGTSAKYKSLQLTEMYYTQPAWEYEEDGSIVDQEYAVTFAYMGARLTVNVTARSIAGLDSIEGTISAAIGAGRYAYYQFTPEETGYYRFEASSASVYPTIDLYDNYMTGVDCAYSNSYSGSGKCYQVGVYRLTGGESYCLRLGNTSSAEVTVTCTCAKLSPAESIEITAYPQTNYYLGVDSQYSTEGLAVSVTYEDGTTETVEAGKPSAATGLSLSTELSGNNAGNPYFAAAGTQTVIVTYMDASTSYEVTVTDIDSIPEMTSDSPYESELASAYDSAYVKFIPEATGYYRFMLTGGEGLTPYIDAVKNSSYTDLTPWSGYNYSDYDSTDNTREKIVYLLAGKTYFMRGYLHDSNGRAAGAYTASVRRLEELTEGIVDGTLSGNSTALYQLTAKEDGYYQVVLDSGDAVGMTLYNSSMHIVSTDNGTKDTQKNRRYYVRKLSAGTVYLAAFANGGSTSQAYSIYASKKPNVTGITVTQAPDKLTYYAQFETAVAGAGLAARISYEDGSSETLNYGEKSSWGLSLSLDYSAAERDSTGRFTAGTQTIYCVYLEQKASFEIEVKDFEPDEAEAIQTETWIDLAIPSGESVFYTYTPAETQTYHFYSKGTSATFGYIYTADGTLVRSDAGDAAENDFSIAQRLEAGVTYILRVRAVSAKDAITTSIRLHDTSAYTEVTGVSLDPEELVIGTIGGTGSLTAAVTPSDARDTAVTWSSADPAVATVDENGNVTAVAEGRTTVTVTTADGGYTATCTVIVDVNPPKITRVIPGNGSILGPTARTLWVYTSDVYGVASVEVKYGLADAADAEYVTAAAANTNGSSIILVQVPLDAFADRDVIEVRLTAVDKGGLRSDETVLNYTVDKAAPEITDLAAVYNKDTVAVDVTWTGELADDVSSYVIYRKNADDADSAYVYLGTKTAYANVSEYSFSDTTVPNDEGYYIYKVVSSDKRGNSESYTTLSVQTAYINQKPEIVLDCASTMTSGEEYSFDLRASTDDVAITSLQIDFGDGSAPETASDVEGAIFYHTYTLEEEVEEATYTVTVTADDGAGGTAELTKTIRVVNLDQVGMLTVQVVDTDNVPLGNAPVYFNMGEEGQVITHTDRNGMAEFRDVPGTYAVGCYVSGYLPVKSFVELVQGEETELTLTLEEKPLVEAQFETNRLTLDEIKEIEEEKGITITADPESSHVLEYVVTLEYSTINIYYDGTTSTVIGDGNTWIPVFLSDEIVVILEIPVGVSILKEFYSVKLYVINNASEEFSLLDNVVTLKVPEGLTLIEEAANPATVEIDEIPGQSTETIEWVVRGDKSGEYQLSADYSGILSDFNLPLSAEFKSDELLKVYGVDNLALTMYIPDSFTNGEFYYNLVMANTGSAENNDEDMYLPNITGEGELLQTKLVSGGETTYLQAMPEVLRGGEQIERFYRITDQISEQLAQYPNYKDFVFYFKNAWVEELTSYGVKLDIQVISASKLAEMYESYRAVPATFNGITINGNAVYGYAAGDVTLTASAEAAANAEYTLTYEWYDTYYDYLGKGQTFPLPTGLKVGETYYYHCKVISERTDNGNKAETEYQQVAVTIAPKTLKVEWSGTEDIYSGEPVNVTAAVSGVLEGDDCTVTVTGGAETNAGEYTAAASLTGVDASNYQLAEADSTCAYTISPLTLELAWPETGEADRIYDGRTSDVKPELSNVLEGDDCTVTVTGGDETNAGEYTATAASLTGEASGNYALPEEGLTYAYTISKREVGLTWSGSEDREYDGEASEVKVALSNLVDGDACMAVVTGGDQTAVGKHVAAASGLTGADADNYTLPEAHSTTYEILQKTVGLVWPEDADRVYDGNASAVTATATDLVGTESCAVTVTGGGGRNAGDYTATATGLSNENYRLPENVTFKYTISPKEVTLNWSGNETRSYDGTASDVTATAVGLVGTDSCTVTVTGGIQTDVGTYTATATELEGDSAANYQLPMEKTCSYEITPKEVTLTWSGNEMRSYDGTASNVTATAEGLVGTDSCTVTVTGGEQTHAGVHTATATGLTGAAAANYQLPAEKTCSYEITAKEVTLAWSGNAARTYDGTASAVTAAAEGLIEGDECSVTVSGGAEKDAGTHTATATGLTGAAAANYQLPTEKTCSYEIMAKKVTLTWNGNGTRTYDGMESVVTATAGGLVEGDECSVTVSGGAETNAGTYTATAESLSNPNYQLPTDGTQSQGYTINKLPAILSWTGTEKTYDGEAATVQAVITNLISSDACDVTVSGGDNVVPGTYTAEATGLTGAAAANYQLPMDGTQSQNYRINKRPVVLSWTGTEKTYDGEAANVQAEITNLISGDKCAAEVAVTTKAGAGTYTATAALNGENADRYELSEDNASCSYTIYPKTVSVTWSGDETREYDGTTSNIQAAVSEADLVAGDTCTVTVKGAAATDAGTYTATAVIDNPNYQISAESAAFTYTITPAKVSVAWSGMETRTYDGTASNVQAAVTGLVSGDTCTVTVTGGTEKNAGTHTAAAAVADNSNYEVAEASRTCQYTITPKTAVLSWSGTATRTYDGTASNVQAAVTNLVSGDICSVTVSGGTGVNVGTYTATATALSNGNYQLPASAAGTYTISQRIAVLSWSGTAAREYNGAPSNVQAAVSNLVAGDTCVVTVSGGTGVNVGTYTATATALSNGNYSLPANATSVYQILQGAQTIGGIQDTYSVVLAKSVTLSPTSSTGGAVTYQTSNSGVAKVSASGKVTAKGTGKAVITVTVAGSGNYKTTTKTVTIHVVPKKATISKLASTKRKQMKVTWKKLKGAGGYEVLYSTSKKFTSAKTKLVKASAKSVTIKKLKAGKKYYVKVRAYVVINGTKYYGAYSKIKKITVKK